jgi:F-type H+-transporting ATPase subunit delta
MRDTTVARKYAEALYELAARNDAVEPYGSAIETVAQLLDEQPRFRLFIETPRVDDDEKKALIRRVFADALPKHVLNFVLVTLDKRRQRLLRDISLQYQALLDEHLGRQHVEVTVARAMDEGTTAMVAERLTEVLGKDAIPHVRVKPEILGGIVVRTGDTIYDGSLRRRLEGMRRRMLSAELADGAPARSPAELTPTLTT